MNTRDEDQWKYRRRPIHYDPYRGQRREDSLYREEPYPRRYAPDEERNFRRDDLRYRTEDTNSRYRDDLGGSYRRDERSGYGGDDIGGFRRDDGRGSNSGNVVYRRDSMRQRVPDVRFRISDEANYRRDDWGNRSGDNLGYSRDDRGYQRNQMPFRAEEIQFRSDDIRYRNDNGPYRGNGDIEYRDDRGGDSRVGYYNTSPSRSYRYADYESVDRGRTFRSYSPQSSPIAVNPDDEDRFRIGRNMPPDHPSGSHYGYRRFQQSSPRTSPRKGKFPPQRGRPSSPLEQNDSSHIVDSFIAKSSRPSDDPRRDHGPSSRRSRFSDSGGSPFSKGSVISGIRSDKFDYGNEIKSSRNNRDSMALHSEESRMPRRPISRFSDVSRRDQRINEELWTREHRNNWESRQKESIQDSSMLTRSPASTMPAESNVGSPKFKKSPLSGSSIPSRDPRMRSSRFDLRNTDRDSLSLPRRNTAKQYSHDEVGPLSETVDLRPSTESKRNTPESSPKISNGISSSRGPKESTNLYTKVYGKKNLESRKGQYSPKQVGKTSPSLGHKLSESFRHQLAPIPELGFSSSIASVRTSNDKISLNLEKSVPSVKTEPEDKQENTNAELKARLSSETSPSVSSLLSFPKTASLVATGPSAPLMAKVEDKRETITTKSPTLSSAQSPLLSSQVKLPPSVLERSPNRNKPARRLRFGQGLRRRMSVPIQESEENEKKKPDDNDEEIEKNSDADVKLKREVDDDVSVEKKLTKFEILEAMEKIDGDISKTEALINLAKSKQQEIINSKTKKETLTSKQKQIFEHMSDSDDLFSRVYMENRAKIADVTAFMDDIKIDVKFLSPQDSKLYLENEKSFAVKKALFMRIIGVQKVEQADKNYKLGHQWWTLRDEWEEKLNSEGLFDGLAETEDSHAKREIYLKTLAVPTDQFNSERDKRFNRYLSTNGRVFDPKEDLRRVKQEVQWSETEKNIFCKKFAKYPKNFRRIASYLPKKTSRDCVNFYYLSKPIYNFKKLVNTYSNRKNFVIERKPKTRRTRSAPLGPAVAPVDISPRSTRLATKEALQKRNAEPIEEKKSAKKRKKKKKQAPTPKTSPSKVPVAEIPIQTSNGTQSLAQTDENPRGLPEQVSPHLRRPAVGMAALSRGYHGGYPVPPMSSEQAAKISGGQFGISYSQPVFYTRYPSGMYPVQWVPNVQVGPQMISQDSVDSSDTMRSPASLPTSPVRLRGQGQTPQAMMPYSVLYGSHYPVRNQGVGYSQRGFWVQQPQHPTAGNFASQSSTSSMNYETPPVPDNLTDTFHGRAEYMSPPMTAVIHDRNGSPRMISGSPRRVNFTGQVMIDQTHVPIPSGSGQSPIYPSSPHFQRSRNQQIPNSNMGGMRVQVPLQYISQRPQPSRIYSGQAVSPNRSPTHRSPTHRSPTHQSPNRPQAPPPMSMQGHRSVQPRASIVHGTTGPGPNNRQPPSNPSPSQQ